MKKWFTFKAVLILSCLCFFEGNYSFGGGVATGGSRINSPDTNVNSNNGDTIDNSNNVTNNVENQNTTINKNFFVLDGAVTDPASLQRALDGLPAGNPPIEQTGQDPDGLVGTISIEGTDVSAGDGSVVGAYGTLNEDGTITLTGYHQTDGGYLDETQRFEGSITANQDKVDSPVVAVINSNKGQYIAYVTDNQVLMVHRRDTTLVAPRRGSADPFNPWITLTVPSSLDNATSVRIIKTPEGNNLMAVQTTGAIFVVTLDGTSLTNVTLITSNASLTGLHGYQASGAVIGYIDSLDKFFLRRKANAGSAFAGPVLVSAGDTVIQGIFTLSKKGAVAVAYLTAAEITIVLDAIDAAGPQTLALVATKVKNLTYNNSSTAIAIVRTAIYDQLIRAISGTITNKGNLALASDTPYVVYVDQEDYDPTASTDENAIGSDDPTIVEGVAPMGNGKAKLATWKISNSGRTDSYQNIATRNYPNQAAEDYATKQSHYARSRSGVYLVETFADLYYDENGRPHSSLLTYVQRNE
ncbi:hypothetical protein COB11_00070 [Candidatus Aerophobetes bacterium]|uniref:Uncharacterized protein n=1 Tax=Aerophobetes bacterium TaxID=2030807 RepID=A0A2A4YNJ8_UNCAE|nr:MAG: hypothetical protein COB11_00070 [Candidatus Aerophobetes bacterium]